MSCLQRCTTTCCFGEMKTRIVLGPSSVLCGWTRCCTERVTGTASFSKGPTDPSSEQMQSSALDEPCLRIKDVEPSQSVSQQKQANEKEFDYDAQGRYFNTCIGPKTRIKKEAVMIWSRWAVHATPAQGLGPTTTLAISHAGRDQIISARLEQVVGTPPASRSVSCLISRPLLLRSFLDLPAKKIAVLGTCPHTSLRACCPSASLFSSAARVWCLSPRDTPRLTYLNDVWSTTRRPLSAACHLSPMSHIQIGRPSSDCDPIEYSIPMTTS